MGEVKITLTTLFDLLRREKDREDLQKLDESFFDDVISYLASKKALLKDDSDTFSSETEKLRLQIQNILKIVKELYDRREKKIINIAINHSKTGSEIVDSSSFLNKEKVFFDEVLNILLKYRGEILLPIYSTKASSKKIVIEEKSQEQEEQEEQVEKDAEDSVHEETETTDFKVTFTDNIPKFIGENMNILGPFGKGDVALLPKNIAELLISTGKAEKT